MPVFAIISEYNPFTLGHEYHVSAARKVCGADYIIGIMSGPFVQRGEPAVADKYVRAGIAAACGLDAVVELPCIYAISNAEQFARGGVRTAAALGADGICCGCEHEDGDVISFLADIAANEPAELSTAIKSELSKGFSYASIRAAVYAEWVSQNSAYSYEYIKSVLTQPNSILALEYKKAVNAFAPDMKLKLIKRVGAGYSDNSLCTSLPSATAVREAIFEGRSFGEAVPSICCELLNKEIAHGNAPVTLQSLEQAILYRIRSMSEEDLLGLYDCAPGMPSLIRSAAYEASGIYEAVRKCVNKSYTASRIRRLFIASLLGQTSKLMEKCSRTDIPLHILAARGNGVLAALSSCSQSPVITRANQFPEANDIFAFDVRAQNIYSLTQAPERRQAIRDYTHKLVLYKS